MQLYTRKRPAYYLYLWRGGSVWYIILFITFARGELKCKHGIFCNCEHRADPTTNPPHTHIELTYFAYKCSVYFLFYVHTFSTYQFSLCVYVYNLMIYDIYYAPGAANAYEEKKWQQPERINIINF